jgi:large subunit ribosomal protein L30
LAERKAILKRLKFFLHKGDRDMKKIKITQVKSAIDRPERQKLTLKALGLNKMNSSKEVEATDQILGMVRKVDHLVKVEELA